jgi:hypothetical protein
MLTVVFNYRFHSFIYRTSWQQDPATTALAYKTNIDTKPYDLPFITAAGMFLSQADNISQIQLRIHNR